MASRWLRLGCCLLSIAAVAAQAAEPEPFVLRAKRIYPAPGADPIDGAAILITSGRIKAVGPANRIRVPGGKRSSACDGGIVVAGFQNSHVHFTEPKWANASSQPADQLSQYLDGMLNRYGFTTVIDTASALENTVELRKRIERGEVRGPRILTAGWALYPHDGIPFYLRDLPPSLLAELRQPKTPDAATANVEFNMGSGADATKLFIATPVPGGEIRRMDPDVARAAVETTHRAGALVLVHPTDIEGLRAGLKAGVDVFVHTTLGNEKLEWDAALVDDMVRAGVALVPTLQLWRYELAKTQLPEATRALAVGDTVQQLRAFAAAGGQVLFGTDVGYMTAYDPTEEYRLMARAIEPEQILASLTTAPAARWKEGERRGRVQPGMEADLVVLEADPLQDVANFTKVRCTFRKGVPIYRSPVAG